MWNMFFFHCLFIPGSSVHSCFCISHWFCWLLPPSPTAPFTSGSWNRGSVQTTPAVRGCGVERGDHGAIVVQGAPVLQGSVQTGHGWAAERQALPQQWRFSPHSSWSAAGEMGTLPHFVQCWWAANSVGAPDRN